MPLDEHKSARVLAALLLSMTAGCSDGDQSMTPDLAGSRDLAQGADQTGPDAGGADSARVTDGLRDLITSDMAGSTPDAGEPPLDAVTPDPDVGALPPVDMSPGPDTSTPPDAVSPPDTFPPVDSAPPGSSWLDDTAQDCPALISEVGLFPDPSDRAVVDGRVHLYDPRYPLWTDGAGKGRWVFIPASATINNSTRAWTYPDGAVFFKHFEYPGQPVETRVLRRRGGSFEYCTYQWNTAGTDAALLGGSNPVAVTITSKPQLAYQIPSEAQCKECHEQNVQPVGVNQIKVPIIGFEEVQLNHTLPGQGSIQLQALAAQGLFSSPPPAPPEAVTGSAVAMAAKGWIHANCAHCHNSGFKFDARHDLVEASTVNVPQNKPYIIPQDPSQSRLYISATDWAVKGVPAMPKIGVVEPDPAASQILVDWINSLP